MDPIYHTAGRDKWLVVFENTVRGIDNILWHCREEWMVILPVALILAYVSYTIQLSPTFPYFRHSPVSKSSATSPTQFYGPLLPLYQRRKASLVAARNLFSPNFTVSPVQSGSSSSRSPPHLPPRPSPLRNSFSHDEDVCEKTLRNPNKTFYFSPLSFCFLNESHTSTTTAIPTEFQRQSKSTQERNRSWIPVNKSIPKEPSLRTRPNAQPKEAKKAKSLDNFRATLFPLLELDELDDLPAATKAVSKAESRFSQRLMRKQRAWSVV